MSKSDSNILTFGVSLESPIVEIEYELWVLKRQLELAQEQFIYLHDQTRIKLEEELFDKGLHRDEAEVDLVNGELRYLKDFLLPRLIWNPVIISSWAVYELGMKRVSKTIDRDSIIARKSNFMKNLNVNFKDRLGAPLELTTKDWADHEMYLTVRNAIAHANGYLDALKNVEQKRDIYRWEKTDSRIQCYEGYLVVSEALAFDCVRLVKKALGSATSYIRTVSKS